MRLAEPGPSWNASSTADWLRAVDDVLGAASAVLGVTLSAPDDLGGSERSAVWRCKMPGDGTVVVKTYPDSAEGRESFAAEAAGLALPVKPVQDQGSSPLSSGIACS